MYISSLEIDNYKSYWTPKALELKPGFNIITSQNNIGKTALLEVLQLAFKNVPHRSPQNVNSSGDVIKANSSARVGITIPRSEMVNYFIDSQTFNVPLYNASITSLIELGEDTIKEQISQAFCVWLLN